METTFKRYWKCLTCHQDSLWHLRQGKFKLRYRSELYINDQKCKNQSSDRLIAVGSINVNYIPVNLRLSSFSLLGIFWQCAILKLEWSLRMDTLAPLNSKLYLFQRSEEGLNCILSNVNITRTVVDELHCILYSNDRWLYVGSYLVSFQPIQIL